MMRRASLFAAARVAAMLSTALPVSVASAQTDALASAPGLLLQLVAPDGATDTRRVRTFALSLEAGERPSPFLPAIEAAGFVATWHGFVELQERDNYAFSFEGVGEFELEIAGERRLRAEHGADANTVTTGEASRIRAGRHELRAVYRSSRGVPPAVRVSWQGRRFAREPLPPQILSHSPDDPRLVDADRLHRARGVIAHRHCLACHDDPARHATIAMPELQKRGPELDAIGDRLEPAWLAAWLRDPRALRPDARMPRVLHGEPASIARDAQDLAAYLASFRTGTASVDAGAGDATAGARSYRELGCIACHRLGDEPAELAPESGAPLVDLRGVGHKFRPGALATFLRDPRRHDAWSRMPDLDLDAGEAQDLEAFLRTRVVSPAPAALVADAADPVRGEALFTELRCESCHAGLRERPAHVALPPLDEVLAADPDPALARGCWSADPARRGAAPDFGFDAATRAALVAFAARAPELPEFGLGRGASAEFAQRQLDEFRCTACHVLDGRTDDWTKRMAIADLLALPAPLAPEKGKVRVGQYRPDLTQVGDKLRTEWLEGLFAGAHATRARPWLAARMPTFPSFADGLATGLAAMHGHPRRSARDTAAADPELVAIGERLVSMQGGFACVTCHGVAAAPPVALFEVQGVNLALAAERLRPDYFARWMWDPPRIDASARMPRYADEAGKTAYADVLGGDARRQFDAIWAYLRSLHR